LEHGAFCGKLQKKTLHSDLEEAMPQPIHIQDAYLAQYLLLFGNVFSLPQWKYFVTVLLGLLHCDERRTLSALLRHVAVGVTIFGLCHFFRVAPWSVDELTAARQAYFYEQMEPVVAAIHAELRAQQPLRRGRPKRTVVTGYLILDDSTHEKRYARAQQGLGRHYSSTEKKVVNGHSLFQSVYLLAGQLLPLTPRLYRQKVTCEAEGVPFVSKIDMAYQEVTTFQPPAGTHTHVLMDCWYMAKRIWRAALDRGWDVTGGLKSNRVMRLTHADGKREWLPARQYAARLTTDDFQPVLWPTEEGDKLVYAHLVKSWVRKLGPCQVLIVKLDPDGEPEQTRYWATSRLDDTLEQMIGHAALRWSIEVVFADFKELMGSDHYQFRSAQGIIRFWALGMCLLQFLDEVRATHYQRQGERLTLGQARQQIREAHQAALLDWIIAQIQAGVTRTELHQALEPAMRL
jgi:hypothetical protein